VSGDAFTDRSRPRLGTLARALDIRDYEPAGQELRVESVMQSPSAAAPRRGTKTGESRVVGVEQELADWLWRDLQRRGRAAEEERELPGPALFQHPEGRTAERRWSHVALLKEWWRACERVGFAPVPLYVAMKHATLSHMVRTGSTLYEAQAAAGHKSPRSTQLYAKLGPVSPALSFKRKR
jgi:integrase